ncbi:SH3 domain-containing protein [Streptomyces sp. NBC_01601]|uniref:SH3 domain-containing protein n=1 Tax=Streptomyces sp. NBC_01601 TaxID=2975892 RepID=UPI002E2C59AA|nr:SH3 domain-containing protein [Streptomyces sp. NBC_01601]
MNKRISAVATLGAALLAVGTLGVGPASAYAVHNVKDYNTTVWGTDGVNLRSTPSVKSKSKGLLVDKDKVRVTATNPGGFGNCEWYRITLSAKSKTGLPKGTVGWVTWPYLKKNVDKGTQGC